MVAVYRTFVSVNTTGMIDKELIGVLPESMRFMAHNGMYSSDAFLTREHAQDMIS